MGAEVQKIYFSLGWGMMQSISLLEAKQVLSTFNILSIGTHGKPISLQQFPTHKYENWFQPTQEMPFSWPTRFSLSCFQCWKRTLLTALQSWPPQKLPLWIITKTLVILMVLFGFWKFAQNRQSELFVGGQWKYVHCHNDWAKRNGPLDNCLVRGMTQGDMKEPSHTSMDRDQNCVHNCQDGVQVVRFYISRRENSCWTPRIAEI